MLIITIRIIADTSCCFELAPCLVRVDVVSISIWVYARRLYRAIAFEVAEGATIWHEAVIVKSKRSIDLL